MVACVSFFSDESQFDEFFMSACIAIFITCAAPNKRSLGATNGLAQTAGLIADILGPAFGTSMFAFSVEHNLLGGYAVYGVLFCLSCLAVMLALQLPDQVTTAWEGEE